ncbi:MAG TPA: hypothetical protein VG456_04320 [Candidatus Sulfopaludibacter sp.]|nr:hypothetical protein [Candidatus Sulfopaludibacter sp.]
MLRAEWILGLVTTPDRAATTAGDLAERSHARGAIWFWSSLLRTALSLLWHSVVEQPRTLARVGLMGLGVDIAASLGMAFLSGMIFFVLHWTWLITVSQLLISFGVGRALARWAPGRELAACVAYAIIASAFNLIVTLIWPAGLSPAALFAVFLTDAAQRTPVLLGALWARWTSRQLKSPWLEIGPLPRK